MINIAYAIFARCPRVCRPSIALPEGGVQSERGGQWYLIFTHLWVLPSSSTSVDGCLLLLLLRSTFCQHVVAAVVIDFRRWTFVAAAAEFNFLSTRCRRCCHRLPLMDVCCYCCWGRLSVDTLSLLSLSTPIDRRLLLPLLRLTFCRHIVVAIVIDFRRWTFIAAAAKVDSLSTRCRRYCHRLPSINVCCCCCWVSGPPESHVE